MNSKLPPEPQDMPALPWRARYVEDIAELAKRITERANEDRIDSTTLKHPEDAPRYQTLPVISARDMGSILTRRLGAGGALVDYLAAETGELPDVWAAYKTAWSGIFLCDPIEPLTVPQPIMTSRWAQEFWRPKTMLHAEFDAGLGLGVLWCAISRTLGVRSWAMAHLLENCCDGRIPAVEWKNNLTSEHPGFCGVVEVRA